jgi:hypothetical protein
MTCEPCPTEALAGGASAEQIGSKMANSIATNRELERTYLPVNSAVIRMVDRARLDGRKAIRAQKFNGAGLAILTVKEDPCLRA